jgi:hypothetical protein
MPRRKNAVPTYSRHKPTGQARTRIAGRDIYLGAYGSRESRLRFAMLAAELARDDRPARGERAEHRRDDAGDERHHEASTPIDAATADDPDRRAGRAAARARRRSDRTLARVGCEPVGYSVAEELIPSPTVRWPSPRV